MEGSQGPARPKTRSIPITGLSTFIAERKSQLEAEDPALSRLGIFTLLNEQWQQLDDATRSSFERKADYSRRTKSRQERFAKKKRRSPEKPGSKVSPYSMFVKSRHEALKQTDPDLSVTERSQQIAQQWRAMSERQKMPFVNEAKRETRKMRKQSDDYDQENGNGSG